MRPEDHFYGYADHRVQETNDVSIAIIAAACAICDKLDEVIALIELRVSQEAKK